MKLPAAKMLPSPMVLISRQAFIEPKKSIPSQISQPRTQQKKKIPNLHCSAMQGQRTSLCFQASIDDYIRIRLIS